MAVNCDILIVGGGVMGTSIAWHLAKRRCGRVVLLEKSYLGAGSSGKSGAIVRQHYSNRLTASMAQKSLRVYEKFDDIVRDLALKAAVTPAQVMLYTNAMIKHNQSARP